jgi:hypothetical protein
VNPSAVSITYEPRFSTTPERAVTPQPNRVQPVREADLRGQHPSLCHVNQHGCRLCLVKAPTLVGGAAHTPNVKP